MMIRVFLYIVYSIGKVTIYMASYRRRVGYPNQYVASGLYEIRIILRLLDKL